MRNVDRSSKAKWNNDEINDILGSVGLLCFCPITFPWSKLRSSGTNVVVDFENLKL